MRQTHLSRSVSANVGVGTSISSEKSIPEGINHREIAIRMQMMDEVQLLFAPEPSKAGEFRSFDVVFLVKINVGVKRRRTGSGHYEEQIYGRTRNIPPATRIVGMRK